ncbi:MAG: hypothetical protein ACKVQW_03610 [Pyrinomonadaceae bacterium]
MAVPFVQDTPKLSKQELEAEKKRARQMEKESKKMQKIFESTRGGNQAPQPYVFKIKGFEARQNFEPPSDCLGCEDWRFTKISVQLAYDKKLNARLIGNRENVTRIIETIDLDRLIDSMNKLAESRKAAK